MKQHKRWTMIVTISMMIVLAAGACGPSGEGETPVAEATSTLAPTAAGRCGDGICDEVEQADPKLCPQDCEPAEAPTPEAEATEPAQGRCGDGICDEMEQKNPNLCPGDCPTPTAPAAVTVEVTPPEPTEAPTAEPEPQPTPTTSQVSEVRESVTSPSGEIAFVGDPATVSTEGGESAEARQANLALILDASGSMNEDLPGAGKTKLAVAKEVMAELIPQIPAEMNGTLWIYGHRHPGEPKSESCKDIEQVFPLGPVDATAYTDTVKGIKAHGWTPISDSIEQAAKGLPVGDFNSIILVSDGEETCGGNPCALAEALKASDAKVTMHVVGYAVEAVAREQLQCIARATGGTYHEAEDAAGLLRALEEAMAATVVETILRVEVVAPDGSEVSEDVWLYEADTGRFVSGFVAWKDNVVPPGDYDLVVHTLPNILYPDLSLAEGSTTIVRILLGAISVVTPDGEAMAADLYEAGANTRLGSYGHDGPVPVVPGTYYVSVNNSVSDPFPLAAGETKDLMLGAIRILTPEGQETAADIYQVATNARLGSYGHDGPVQLVPGDYYVQINNSNTEQITVESGQTTEVLLGAVHVDGQFTIYSGANRLGYYGNTLLLAPGTYRLELDDSRTIENVEVRAGEVTEVK